MSERMVIAYSLQEGSNLDYMRVFNTEFSGPNFDTVWQSFNHPFDSLHRYKFSDPSVCLSLAVLSPFKGLRPYPMPTLALVMAFSVDPLFHHFDLCFFNYPSSYLTISYYYLVIRYYMAQVLYYFHYRYLFLCYFLILLNFCYFAVDTL